VAGPVCDLSCYINFRFRGVAFKHCITCNPKTIYNSLVIVTFVLAKETMRQQNIQIRLLSLVLLSGFMLSIFPLKSEVSPKMSYTKTYQKNFYGTIGNLGVRMTLNIHENTDGPVKYDGYYSYNHVGKNIKLSGIWPMRPGKATHIQLTEKVGGNVTGTFSLLPKSYSDYTTLIGSWYSTSGKQLKVNLRSVTK